ncbi:hypothetical protein Hanom_Chr09g00855931 [Helianthus anomalus]
MENNCLKHIVNTLIHIFKTINNIHFSNINGVKVTHESVGFDPNTTRLAKRV